MLILASGKPVGGHRNPFSPENIPSEKPASPADGEWPAKREGLFRGNSLWEKDDYRQLSRTSITGRVFSVRSSRILS